MNIIALQIAGYCKHIQANDLTARIVPGLCY